MKKDIRNHWKLKLVEFPLVVVVVVVVVVAIIVVIVVVVVVHPHFIQPKNAIWKGSHNPTSNHGY